MSARTDGFDDIPLNNLHGQQTSDTDRLLDTADQQSRHPSDAATKQSTRVANQVSWWRHVSRRRDKMQYRYTAVSPDDDGEDITDHAQTAEGSATLSGGQSERGHHPHSRGPSHDHTHSHAHDHNHGQSHDPPPRADEKEDGWATSCLGTTRTLLSRAATAVFTTCPPPEDPCGPDVPCLCCIWSAAESFCMPEPPAEAEGHPHEYTGSHSHGHTDGHTHLQLRARPDPMDRECTVHCCQEGQHFLSMKAQRQPGCHG